MLSGIVLLLLDWRLALLTFASPPLFALALWRADRLNTMLMQRLVLSGEMLSARVLDYIQGLPTLSSLGEAERYQPLLQALSNHRLASTATVIALMPAVAMGWVLLDAGFVVMLSAGAGSSWTGLSRPGHSCCFWSSDSFSTHPSPTSSIYRHRRDCCRRRWGESPKYSVFQFCPNRIVQWGPPTPPARRSMAAVTTSPRPSSRGARARCPMAKACSRSG